MGSIRGSTAPGANVRAAPVDGSAESIAGKADAAGGFEFPIVAAGWYILSASSAFQFPAARCALGRSRADTGTPPISDPSLPPPAFRLDPKARTRADRLRHRWQAATYSRYQRVVIVGIFKSGMDETLRMDCPFQLVTGEVGWPSSIGLTAPLPVPDALRDEVEKKRQEVLKSGPPGAQPRPERVVGFYGIFVSPADLSQRSLL